MEVMKGSNGGGCCIARYTTHPNNYYPNHVSKMDRIMLRFRPIAPKPTLSGPNSSSDSVGSTESVRPNTAGKRKRKTTGTSTGTNTGGKRKNTRSPDDHKSNNGETCHVAKTTLPLLPETPDLSPRKNNNTNNNNNNSNNLPTWLSFGPSNEEEVVPTKVTVEGVTDAWLNNNNAMMMRCTDEERKRMLDGDTCPGFISDAWNRVWWTNREYRKMVAGGGDTWRKMETVMVAVKLEMKDKVAFPVVSMYSAFTAKVRVEYGGHTVVVPCDAWRLDGGGFAWRLDVKAALCLAL